MNLSSLTQQDKNKLAAKLDGWTKLHIEHRIVDTIVGVRPNYPAYLNPATYDVPSYSTSYDAIIPLIQKQFRASPEMWCLFRKHCGYLFGEPFTPMDVLIDATPSQLLAALLVATGKAEI